MTAPGTTGATNPGKGGPRRNPSAEELNEAPGAIDREPVEVEGEAPAGKNPPVENLDPEESDQAPAVFED